MPTPLRRRPTRLRLSSFALLLLATQLQGCRTVLDPIAPVASPIEGQVMARGSDLETVVVYLESLDEPVRGPQAAPSAIATLEAGTFTKRVIAIAPGQEIEFIIEDDILHQLFSYDENNAFDLGTSDRANPGRVRFQHPGPLQFYCSLHPAEGGHIFVTAGRHLAALDNEGRFRIPEVPPGRYSLKTWSATTQPTSRSIDVPLPASPLLELTLEPAVEGSK